MRKQNYPLSLLMLLLLCGGVARAQQYDGKLWQAATRVSSLEEIVPGRDYVLKGPGTDASLSDVYLCADQGEDGSEGMFTECVYQFESAGVDVEGRTQYVLRQTSTGKYVANVYDVNADDVVGLTDDRSAAFRFTLGVAHTDTTSTAERYAYYFDFEPEDTTLTYDDLPQPLFVLARINAQGDYTYLSSAADDHCFASDHHANVWEIYTDVTEVRG